MATSAIWIVVTESTLIISESEMALVAASKRARFQIWSPGIVCTRDGPGRYDCSALAIVNQKWNGICTHTIFLAKENMRLFSNAERTSWATSDTAT